MTDCKENWLPNHILGNPTTWSSLVSSVLSWLFTSLFEVSSLPSSSILSHKRITWELNEQSTSAKVCAGFPTLCDCCLYRSTLPMGNMRLNHSKQRESSERTTETQTPSSGLFIDYHNCNVSWTHLPYTPAEDINYLGRVLVILWLIN